MNIKLNRHHFLILHHLYLIPLSDINIDMNWGGRIVLTYWLWGVLLYICSFIRQQKRRWIYYGIVHGFTVLMLCFLTGCFAPSAS